MLAMVACESDSLTAPTPVEPVESRYGWIRLFCVRRGCLKDARWSGMRTWIRSVIARSSAMILFHCDTEPDVLALILSSTDPLRELTFVWTFHAGTLFERKMHLADFGSTDRSHIYVMRAEGAVNTLGWEDGNTVELPITEVQ